MKRFFAFLLICVVLLSNLAVLAETKIFDHTVFEKYSDNYHYDKFDKNWDYGDAYTKKFKEFTIDIYLAVAGDNSLYEAEDGTEFIFPPMSGMTITVTSNKGEPIYEVEKISIFVDEKLYSYSNKGADEKSILQNMIDSNDLITSEKEKNTTVFPIGFGNIGKQMVEDIANAKEISLKIYFRTYKYSILKSVSTTNTAFIIEPTLKQFSKIITVCKNIQKHNVLGDIYHTQFINGMDYMSEADSLSEASVR